MCSVIELACGRKSAAWLLDMDKTATQDTTSDLPGDKEDATSASKVTSAAPKIRKFSRAELFRLGRTVGDKLDAKILDLFEHSDWTHYNLDIVDDANYGPQSLTYGSLASFGRKHSELGQYQQPSEQAYHSISFAGRSQVKLPHRFMPSDQTSHHSRGLMRQFSNSNNSNVTNVLTRMTSSPSIDYNIGGLKSNKVNAQQTQPMSLGLSGKLAGGGFQRMNGTLDNNQQTKSSARLYGSLRRDNSRQLDSDSEPLSLPYNLVNDNTNGYSSLHHRFDFAKNELSSQKALDEIGSSPVQRITATLSDKRAEERAINNAVNNEDDEDDFDVTSLMSITVLSDIRTIRPNAPKFSESKLTRQLSTGAPRLSKMRSQDGYVPARMSARSRTSLDLSYQRRATGRNAYSNQNSHHASNYADENYNYEPAEYQSLDMPLDYHQADDRLRCIPAQYHHSHGHNVDPRLQMAPHPLEPYWTPSISSNPTKAKPKPTGFKTKTPSPQDSEAARIIENFKAQVKARAKAQLDEIESKKASIKDGTSELKLSEQSAGKVSADKQSHAGTDGKGSQQEADASVTEKSKSIAEQQLTNERASEDKFKREPTLDEISKAKETTASRSISKPTTSTVAGVLSAVDPKVSGESQESQPTTTTTNSRRVSNIPRLISLQKAKVVTSEASVRSSTVQVTRQANDPAAYATSTSGAQQVLSSKVTSASASVSASSTGKRLLTPGSSGNSMPKSTLKNVTK